MSSPKMPLAISLATSMSKPTSSPLSSIKPKGGASLVTPTMTLPRARTSSSLDLPLPRRAAWLGRGWLSLGEDQAGTRGNAGYVRDEFAP